MLKRKSLRSEHVTLAGHGLTGEGDEAVLVFETRAGERLRLVLPLDQLPVLARGLAHMDAEARREGRIREPSAATPVDRWSTVKENGQAVLTLSVLGGMELRFAITPESGSATSRSEEAAEEG